MTIMTGLTAPRGSAEVESWCRVGFIEFQRGSYALSGEARKNLHNHLCEITKKGKGLPFEVQQKLKAIHRSLHEEFPLSYCHHFPIQGFLRISQCLISIENASQFPPLKDIVRVQKVYKKYLRDNTVANTKRLTIQTFFASPNLDTIGNTAPPSEFSLQGARDTRDRKCSWAKRLCQTLWKSLYKDCSHT
jgi:hypothetical protein